MSTYLKYLLLLIGGAIPVAANAQQPQKANRFVIVDAGTQDIIPAVVVHMIKAKRVITTENDGVFNIPGDLSIARDTIAFYVQNYHTLKLPLSKLANMQTIALYPKPKIAKTIPAKFSQTVLLNDHAPGDIAYYAGVTSEDAPFNYMQIAQRFNTGGPGNRLAAMIIHKTSDWLSTTFRIRIYDTDPATGVPSEDLCNKVIQIDNKKDVDRYLDKGSDFSYNNTSRELKIDLRKHNVIIPGKSFFVAIEWQRTFLNAIRAPVFNNKTNKTDTTIAYRPYIGISPVAGPKLNIWVMDIDRKWKPYDHFAPFGTDLAITATVEVP